MIHRRNLFLAAVAAAATLAAPSAADAASCAKELPAPDGAYFEIDSNGMLAGSGSYEQGFNFAGGHGKLLVNGASYPEIEADGCTQTAGSVRYPARPVGTVTVSRSVESIGDRLRWVDTFVNGDKNNEVHISFILSVTDEQHIIDSESGDARGTSGDHWSVHKNFGGSYPFLQWGVGGDGAKAPSLVSGGSFPQFWEQEKDVMPDATLSYGGTFLKPGETVRLVHTAGTTKSKASSLAAVADRAAPLAGLTKDVAATVINWGDDPDADGVGKADDGCPGIKGSGPNGCFGSKPADPAPAPSPQPDPPVVAPPAVLPPPVARDTKAPLIRLTKLPRSAKRSVLTRKGLAPRIACDEVCSISVRVTGRARGKRKATTLLATKPTRASLASRTVRLKVSARRLRRLAKRQVTVVVTVVDAAGNRRSLTRVVRVGR